MNAKTLLMEIPIVEISNCWLGENEMGENMLGLLGLINNNRTSLVKILLFFASCLFPFH